MMPKVAQDVDAASSYTWTKRKKKKEKTRFSAPSGSVCKRPFLCILIDCLGVKSLVEHDGEGYKFWNGSVLEIFSFL